MVTFGSAGASIPGSRRGFCGQFVGQHRQDKKSRFSEILSMCRVERPEQTVVDELIALARKEYVYIGCNDVLHLFARRKYVDNHNQKRLLLVDGTEKVFIATDCAEGSIEKGMMDVGKSRLDFQVPHRVVLRIGAMVRIVKAVGNRAAKSEWEVIGFRQDGTVGARAMGSETDSMFFGPEKFETYVGDAQARGKIRRNQIPFVLNCGTYDPRSSCIFGLFEVNLVGTRHDLHYLGEVPCTRETLD